uniref:Uncharacterized protein n=1 Tax=Octopus bimaculoides TaxID=37653 RepID=A0A0L8I8Y6_OCTBM
MLFIVVQTGERFYMSNTKTPNGDYIHIRYCVYRVINVRDRGLKRRNGGLNGIMGFTEVKRDRSPALCVLPAVVASQWYIGSYRGKKKTNKKNKPFFYQLFFFYPYLLQMRGREKNKNKDVGNI